jgi:hypothetical protein
MNVKTQRLLCDLYVGIAMNGKKNNYYETYMWVLQWMQKPNDYYATYIQVL